MRRFFLFLCCIATPCLALIAEPPLSNPAGEQRAQALFHDIRCVVCQSESIAESPAEIAADMRREIRQKITAGEDDAAIKSYLVARYGEQVLMQPPFAAATWLLWLTPLALFILGFFLARSVFARRA